MKILQLQDASLEYSGVRSQKSGVRMRKPAKTFEDLLVWQKAHLFVLAV
ncbi:MAG: hypothetical protein AB1815_09380 [Bacillota bacterium]